MMQPERTEPGAILPERPIRILAVDDDSMVLDSLRAIVENDRPAAGQAPLEWCGSLRSVTELIEACKRSCPDLVLLDLEMPGQKPLNMLGRLFDQCPDVRVMIFSSCVPLDVIDRAIDYGAWGVVAKFQPTSVLLHGIRQVAAGKLFVNTEVLDERWKLPKP